MLRSTWTLVAAIAVSGCAARDYVSSSQLAPWAGYCYPQLEQHVIALSGESATDCGFLSLDSPDGVKSEASMCARDAVLTGDAFRFGHQGSGEDSGYCDVAIRDERGSLWALVFDSDTLGGGGGPRAIWIYECESIDFSSRSIAANRFFEKQGCELKPDVTRSLLEQFSVVPPIRID